MLAAYTLNYFQVPQLLLKRKYLLFVLSFGVSVYLFSAFARYCVVHLAEPLIRKDFSRESIREILSDGGYLFTVYFPAVYTVVFIMLIIKIFKERFEQKHEIEVLQKEKVHHELQFLKAQIHPHFLFNTLNNLYALTLAKSDVAPAVVMKLSDMLDYILYQCNEPTVTMQQEVDLIQGYIDLEKLRHGANLQVTFQTELDNPGTPIAPLILLSMVENAFKHGVHHRIANPSIDIHLVVANGILDMMVENSKVPKQLMEGIVSTNQGIGKVNLQRQLALNYHKRHHITIEDTEEIYRVSLTINL
ncbi:hypothetical protein BKI52_27950 [marine bacterium AO1-C]|nr:hypothetical protein BKI52_27950 [marine bacterium AO1-C]